MEHSDGGKKIGFVGAPAAGSAARQAEFESTDPNTSKAPAPTHLPQSAIPAQAEAAPPREQTEQLALAQHFDYLSKYASDIILLANDRGQIIEANDRALEEYGYDRETLLRLSLKDLRAPESQAGGNTVSIQMTNHVNSLRYEIVHQRSDKTTFPVEVSARLILADGKQFEQEIIRNITERKQAELQLLERELQYRTLANSGQALIWTSGTDKLCNYFNEVWLKFTGRSLEQEMGNGWAEGVYPDDLQHCLDVYVSAFDRREKFSMDYRLRRHDGEYRWVQDDGCPRYDRKGEFIGYIGYCLDITERKQAEEATARYAHDMGERIKEISCLRDITMLSLKKNWSIERVLESCARRMPDGWLVPSRTCARISLDNQVFETPNFQETEWKLAAKIPFTAGSSGAVEVFYIDDGNVAIENPFLDEEHDLINSIATQIGLSLERRWAEEKLKLQRNSFKQILNTMTDGIYVVSRSYEIEYVNPVIKREFGKVDGRKCYAYLHGRTAVCPWCRNDEVFNGKTVRWEWHSDRTGKDYDLLDTPMTNPDGSISKFEVFHDITERKYFETELMRSNAKLEQFNSAISSDLSVAHDVMSHIMRSDGLLDPQIRYFMRPTQQFGGDFIAAARDSKGDLRVMLADVTGHGLQAALFLLPIFRIFYAMAKKGLPTRNIVMELNQTMLEISETGHFIAAAVTHISREYSSIEIWNGGIPTAFHVKKNGDLHQFASQHLPLGIIDADTFDAATEIFSAPSGILLLCSDGLTEAENDSGEPFGDARFETLLRESSPEELFENILSALEVHLGGCAAHDDLSMVLAQCDA